MTGSEKKCFSSDVVEEVDVDVGNGNILMMPCDSTLGEGTGAANVAEVSVSCNCI